MATEIPAEVQLAAAQIAEATAAASVDPATQQPKRRQRKKKNGELKRMRAKKAPDAPRRPKSAYMFFLAEFRAKYKTDHPEIANKVADVARAAGQAWRTMPDAERQRFDNMSNEDKDSYRVKMIDYDKVHPKEDRRPKKERDPGDLKRPQSAYFFFLADFREEFKEQHKGEGPISVSVVGKAAGLRWKELTDEQKAPYVAKSSASKAEYARLKTLTPAERVMVAAAARMQEHAGTQVYPAVPDAKQMPP